MTTQETLTEPGNLEFPNDQQQTPEIILFPEKIIVSCVTKSKGVLTKKIRINPETKELVKDGSECSMYAGRIEQIPVSSPDGFSRLLRTRASNQALVHGVSEHPEAKIVTKGKVGLSPKGDAPVIARSKQYISYSEGPGVMLFDHDKARAMSVGSLESLKSYSPTDLLACTATVHAGIANAASVSTSSTSSGIYSPDGELLRGEGSGSHTYLFVKCAQDIPRYMETLGKYLILAGYGRIEISRSGAFLTRTPIDLVVGSPERLDFVAGAVCEDGLVQRLPEPIVKNGDLLDTSKLVDLTTEQENQYNEILEALKAQARPTQEKVVGEYIEKESVKLAQAKGITRDAARTIVASRQDHVLADDDILYFAHLKEGITIRGVLDNPHEYNGKSLADPLEPEYEGGSKTKAKFYWNDGRPVINSFCHGSVKYTFFRFQKSKPVTEVVFPASEPWFADSFKTSSVARFIDKEPPDLEWIFKGTLLARTTGLLVGPGAAGKSTLAILLLIAVATGRDILPGIFTPTKAGKVLGVFAEDDEAIIHHRMHNMVNILFFDDPEAKELLRQNMRIVTTTGHDVRFLSQAGGDLMESPFFKEVFEAIKGVEGLCFIVLDPVSRYHGAEENDNGAGTFLVSLLEKIAQQTGAAVLALHHVGKRAGSDVHGFDLDSAMHQDASRGASGLTNGVRWQCNLFGLPEKNVKKIIGVPSSVPGQYLALKVCKKNYGAPEPVFFLERRAGGMLVPVERTERTIDADLDELVKGLVLDAVMKTEGQLITQRILLDGNCRLWKENDSRISRRVVDQTVAACILNQYLFERSGKNASGKTIAYLSLYPEPPVDLQLEKTNLEPEGEPEDLEPEEPEGTGKNSLPVYNSPDLLGKIKPEGSNRKNDALRFVSARNCETVGPEKTLPYGEDISPSGLSRRGMSPWTDGGEDAEYF